MMNIYKYILLISFFWIKFCNLSIAQNKIDGSWIRDNGEVITFNSLGHKNPGYLYIKSRNVIWVKKKDNYLIFNIKNEIFKSVFQIKNNVLTFKDPQYGIITAQKYAHNLPESLNLKSILPDSNSYFNYSTNTYYAGDFYDLTLKGPLPFYINRLFILKHKIDTISFLLNKKTFRDSVYDSEENAGRCIFHFKNGYVSRMIIISPKPKTYRDTITWVYHYNKNDFLDSISIPYGKLKFDKDNWAIDSLGFKLWEKYDQPVYWEYENELPSKSLKTFGGSTERRTRFYVYDSKKQLIEINEIRDKSTYKKYYLGYTLEYNSIGIPSKVSRVFYPL